MQEKETKNKKNYLNLILDDFYICKERLKVYEDVCPTILSERYGLKIVVIYFTNSIRKILIFVPLSIMFIKKKMI